MMNANAVIERASEGQIKTCGEVRRSACAWLMSLPQLMVEVGRPTPRNESVASATIAAANEIVVTAITGAIEFGNTWRINILNLLTPIAVDAIT